MGLFGPTREEAQLKRKVSDLETELATTAYNYEVSRTQLLQKTEEYQALKDVTEVHEVASAALHRVRSDEIHISAVEVATEVVKARYISHAEAAIADEVIEKQADAIRMQRSPEWDDEIRERITKGFEEDGTFARLTEQVDGEDIKKIADEVRANFVTEQQAYNQSRSRQAQLEQQARTNLEESGELDEIRAAATAEAQAEWDEEALREARLEIAKAVAAEKDEYKANKKADWKNSWHGREFVKATRRMMREKWDSASLDAVQEEVRDQELAELLAEKARLGKEALREENFYAKHLDHFSGRGVDTTQIPVGSTVEVFLGGEVVEQDIVNSNGYRTGEQEHTLHPVRQLVLSARGDNLFQVDRDSLSEAEIVYARDAAIKQGTLIHIGRRHINRSNGDSTPILEPSVREGVVLFYDEDTTDPEITSTQLRVMAMSIDGNFADKDLKIEELIKRRGNQP